MLRLAAVLLVSVGLSGADRWVQFRSGPFEVLSGSGERAGRQRLNELEQFRNAVEQVLGNTDLQPVWPVRILVLHQAKQAGGSIGLARNAYAGAVTVEGPLPRSLLRACASLLIESMQGRLPQDVERGLEELFSTLEFRGPQVILGTSPPAAERTRDWARMHMLAVTPAYFGKLRILVYNLERGVETGPAYRNAFNKSPAEIDKEADAYLRAGNFPTAPLHRRPIDPETDFKAEPVEAARVPVLTADLILSTPARSGEARALYQAVLKSSPPSPEALEGLGLLALREKRTDEARSLLARAVEASSTSARAFVEYARLETDRDKSVAALEKAAKLNPRWAEPYFEMAQREPDPAKRIQLLVAAAKREPRNLDYWRALAEAQESAGEFIDAAKSWASAEVVAGSPEERQSIRDIRRQAEARRRDQEEAERKRKADEEQRELEALKQKSMASIQAALDKANREHPATPPSSGKVEQWWNGPRPDGKIQGFLRQVDCLGKQARLVIEGDDRKVTRLLIRDPSQIFINGGEKSFGCGPQKPARRIVAEYFAKPDAKLGTAGEVAVIEFP
jgi:hypothetical protein